MLEARKKDKEIYESIWNGTDIPWVQEGLEELISRITDGEFCTSYLWDAGIEIFYDWEAKYDNKIYDMVNLRCGPTCPHYVTPTENNKEWCNYCDVPTKEDPFACSACADVPLNMIEVLVFKGLKSLLAFAQDKKIDYELIYDIIESYAYHYEDGKLERLLMDMQTAKRWQALKDKITTKQLTIGTINKEDEKYDIRINGDYFDTTGYKGIFSNINRHVNCLEIVNNIYGSDIIKWDIGLLENLEELYDLNK